MAFTESERARFNAASREERWAMIHELREFVQIADTVQKAWAVELGFDPAGGDDWLACLLEDGDIDDWNDAINAAGPKVQIRLIALFDKVHPNMEIAT